MEATDLLTEPTLCIKWHSHIPVLSHHNSLFLVVKYATNAITFNGCSKTMSKAAEHNVANCQKCPSSTTSGRVITTQAITKKMDSSVSMTRIRYVNHIGTKRWKSPMDVLWGYEMAIVLGRMESGTVTAEPRLKTYSFTRRCQALSANATLDDLASVGLLASAYSCNEMKRFYTIYSG